MAFALGILFEILATMVGTAGKQLISYSSKAEDKRTQTLYKVGGLCITTLVGPVLDMAAYALAPQAVIAPLNGLDIVWNTLTAPFTLGERLRWRHVIGSSLVFVGAATTSFVGPRAETQESLEWVQGVFFSYRFALYLMMMGGFLLFSCITLMARPKGVGDQVRGVLLGCTAGAIAGNMFFISAGLGLLRSSASTGDWVAWQNWLPYVVLVCGILVAVSNIPFMTKGLQEYEALFMVTIFEGCHIFVACFSSVWVLGEMQHMAWSRCVVYWLCVGLIVAGLIVIRSTARGRAADDADDRPLRRPNEAPRHSEESGILGLLPCGESPTSDEEAAEAPRSASWRKGEAIPSTSFRSTGAAVVWASGFSGIGSVHFVHPDDVSTDSEEYTSDELDAATTRTDKN